ncbi:MAG TPA: leucyl/phenylalanyl-tRNA--protein transferase [Steroidobacteraceae bacterium]|jgi:leucyl/phenylalanyl-tRNA--protein transferase|nr:leucyl/phenylalanyl-tRNA--protein transferase [Steroidobacteraceae bacterium]
MSPVYWLSRAGTPWFPPASEALKEPDGLLAAGGDLSVERLLAAYEHGIFPWYAPGQPVLWWSPDPRAVLYPKELRVSRSLQKRVRNGGLVTRLDSDFAAVIRACAAPRASDAGTWLTEEMIEAYQKLHALGHAHSVETWQGEQLVGGLYGVCLGRIFFGESMFSRETDASKVALIRLVHECQQREVVLIDCQVTSRHLQSLGSRPISRSAFLGLLKEHCRPLHPGRWE